MKNPRVSIIILNWNGWKDTLECVDSLLKIKYDNYEIIVVDNASSGDDVKTLKNKYKNKVRLIKNSENLGFAKGNNIAIKQVLNENKSKYVLLLNNDTVVDKNFLKKLVEVGESDNKIAVLGPKMYYYDYNGKKNVIWYGGGEINWWKYPGYYHIDEFKEDKLIKKQKPKETTWVSGASIMMNIKRINPLLNEIYYFGEEDVDKCLKIRNQGYKIIYVPNSIIWHKVGMSRIKKKGFKQKINRELTNLKLIKNNNPFWIFSVPYFSAMIMIKFVINNLKNSYHLNSKDKDTPK